MAEAYTVGYDRINYHAPIKSPDREGALKAREQEITDNMVRYLGEYRLGVKFDEFFYRVEQGEFGERYFASKETGPIRDIYRRSIKSRSEQGLGVKREVAECLGFEQLEEGLLDAPVGTMAIWVSPPGEKKDGYGNYSFTFLSQVEEVDGERQIKMIPYRNEKTLGEHNSYITRLTGEHTDFTKDTEFLSTPFIIPQNQNIRNLEDILRVIGEQEEINTSWSDELIEAAWPLLQGYLYLVKNNASDEELIQAKHALENFAIAFNSGVHRELEVRLNEPFETSAKWVIQEWGAVAPPEVRGSCGMGGEDGNNSSTPMELQESLGKMDEDDYGAREFPCPSCKRKIRRPYNQLIKKCPNSDCKDPESVAC